MQRKSFEKFEKKPDGYESDDEEEEEENAVEIKQAKLFMIVSFL